MSELMEQRYRRRRPVRKTVLVLVIGVVAAAGLGWLAWAAWFHSNPAIDAAVASYDVRSDHRVDVSLEVRLRNQDVTGTCLLRATAVDHSVVGEQYAKVDGQSAKGRLAVQMTTERRATSVSVVSCAESS